MELQLGGQSLPVCPTRPELWAINDIKSARLVLWAEANYEQVFCASVLPLALILVLGGIRY
jgi:hypothetical protein